MSTVFCGQQEQQERARAVAEAEKAKVVKTHLDEPLEENVNRLTIEGETARSVEEAISVLTWVTALYSKRRRSVFSFIIVSFFIITSMAQNCFFMESFLLNNTQVFLLITYIVLTISLSTSTVKICFCSRHDQKLS